MMYKHWQTQLNLLQEQDSYRSLKHVEPLGGPWVNFEGQRMLNLSSNDYLGIAHDPQHLRNFYTQITEDSLFDQFGLSATSSRLLTGNHPAYQELERTLCYHYQKSGALMFNSGYHANLGILPALIGKGDLILSDKLNHASIIDGARLCDADLLRYKHLNYEHLRSFLEKNRSKYRQVIIITETIFSMDGDVADLQQLCALKEEFDCLLYIDEAHAIGTRGEHGLGICEEQNVIDSVDIISCPLGKGMASIGCFTMMDEVLQEYLINKMRPLIFTTALPPINIAWTQYVFGEILRSKAKRDHLKDLSVHSQKSLSDSGFKVESESNILPLILGENELTVRTAKALQDGGFLVFPIRPPSVPKGSSRLRISLTADIRKEDLTSFIDILQKS
ncbi:8-amino-7-oxononanoate synthase [Persicobacter sp. CCB-QB2]|uniref:aminotransferase class I/II-fold pyridoxal phosphate-dependent enzyme n=1 Tax=Persicobacter sp. CCB-QB2 TaxID=1561025 RepID=UPI0009E1D24F|nr:8-amino-7-oxononanoate synthase [Persicobacter sp. CCB-QB2]